MAFACSINQLSKITAVQTVGPVDLLVCEVASMALYLFQMSKVSKQVVRRRKSIYKALISGP
jgi:hypothetical protein